MTLLPAWVAAVVLAASASAAVRLKHDIRGTTSLENQGHSLPDAYVAAVLQSVPKAKVANSSSIEDILQVCAATCTASPGSEQFVIALHLLHKGNRRQLSAICEIRANCKPRAWGADHCVSGGRPLPGPLLRWRYMGTRTGKRQHSFIPVTNHGVRLLPWQCCAYGARASVLTGYGAAHMQGGHL
jgi:hypothetical protein